MRHVIKAAVLIAWLAAATLAYAKVWYLHLDSFPEYPAWVGLRIGELKNLISNEDDPELLHTLYMLILSFVNVAVLTGVAWISARRILGRRPH
jgi:hypothetical protein